MMASRVFVFFAFAAALVAAVAPAGPPVTEESLLPEDFDGLTEAPAAFDGRTNGFESQAQFDKDAAQFDEVETPEKGLGPVFNARSCSECHFNPGIGGNSQVTELRSGHFDGVNFTPSPGGSLIHSKAIAPEIQERVLADQEVRALRLTPALFGLGFVEAVDGTTLAKIAAAQPPAQRGQLVNVPVLEAKGATRVGRFGWKDQHASLLSFAADAYLNEVGFTSPLQPVENLSNGRPVGAFNKTVGLNDVNGADTDAFTRLMRALKAPPRDRALAVTPESVAGQKLFLSVGCAVCHTPAMRTVPPGTLLNAGRITVSPALANRVIRPYSDFLLHDVGTGDGIVMDGMEQSTRLKIRTAPLWGLRTRNRLMHDGLSYTRQEAILRHGNEAAPARDAFNALADADKFLILTFLRSL